MSRPSFIPIRGHVPDSGRPARSRRGPSRMDPELLQLILADRETIENYRNGRQTPEQETT